MNDNYNEMAKKDEELMLILNTYQFIEIINSGDQIKALEFAEEKL